MSYILGILNYGIFRSNIKVRKIKSLSYWDQKILVFGKTQFFSDYLQTRDDYTIVNKS